MQVERWDEQRDGVPQHDRQVRNVQPGVGVEQLGAAAGPVEGLLGELGAGAAVALECEIVESAAADEEAEADDEEYEDDEDD